MGRNPPQVRTAFQSDIFSPARLPLRPARPRRRASAWVWHMFLAILTGLCVHSPSLKAEGPSWLQLEGVSGAGTGKRIVLISGDEEYRSEEALPMLAEILTRRHGFDCTVLFSIDELSQVNPEFRSATPGIDQLEEADLMVIATRFRELPADQMTHVINYLKKGKPVIGLRTATHAFLFPKTHEFARFSSDYEEADYEGGFGRQILGERWVAHHGEHGKQSTRGIVINANHPITRGVGPNEIWGPTDVYAVRLPLPPGCEVLVEGEVADGMEPSSKAVTGPQNSPRMPVAWTRTYRLDDGPEGRVFTTTMGASQDFQNPGLRRLFVNACFWALRMESAISPDLEVDPVGEYAPSPFGFGKQKKGLLPKDFLTEDTSAE